MRIRPRNPNRSPFWVHWVGLCFGFAAGMSSGVPQDGEFNPETGLTMSVVALVAVVAVMPWAFENVIVGFAKGLPVGLVLGFGFAIYHVLFTDKADLLGSLLIVAALPVAGVALARAVAIDRVIEQDIISRRFSH